MSSWDTSSFIASENLPGVPSWALSAGKEAVDSIVFQSGCALTVLDALVSETTHGVPGRLLANRLALRAAAETSKLEGRLTPEAAIRDAYRLTPPGDPRGPDGDLLAFWREIARPHRSESQLYAAIGRDVSPTLAPRLSDHLRLGSLRAQAHGPLSGCVSVLREVLECDDRAERIACALSDIVLARFLGWSHVLPISALHFNATMRGAVLADGPQADLEVQLALLKGIEEAIGVARDLGRRAAALRAIAPKLRAKGSDAAVALFLREDAVAPASMLSPVVQGTSLAMTGRAARRFCDRLVALGVARELTGRATFRLYGLAP